MKQENKFDYKLDPLLTNEIRFFIMSLLAMYEIIDFKFLKEQTKATDGNLSANLRKLEDAKYLKAKKEFVGRRPKTSYKITKIGLKNLKEYLETMDRFKNMIKI